jgi:hypothetical protein
LTYVVKSACAITTTEEDPNMLNEADVYESYRYHRHLLDRADPTSEFAAVLRAVVADLAELFRRIVSRRSH